VSDVYAALEAIAQGTSLPTATICEALEVSRSAYYDWLTRQPGARERELDELTPAIVEIFVRHRRRYGARRIASEPADEDIVCSPRRVAGVLRSQGLRAIQPRSVVPRTTDSGHTLGYSPNLLLDAGEPTRVDELWVGDVTYLPCGAAGSATWPRCWTATRVTSWPGRSTRRCRSRWCWACCVVRFGSVNRGRAWCTTRIAAASPQAVSTEPCGVVRR
jgi:hypothetical protein